MKKRQILLLLLTCTAFSASAQQIAIKTNLLSDMDGALNAGMEYTLGPRSTINLSGSLRPWERSEEYVNRYWIIRPEYRYWMCQKFNGSYWGIYLNGAQFNIGGKKMPFGLFPWLKEHRYAGWMAGAGISYGYQLMLDRHWNMEASLGAGYEYIDYKRYKCPAKCSDLQKKDRYHYWGITHAAVSIVYIF